MFRLGFIDIPALDRLIDFLEAAQQAEIDNSTGRLQALTLRLQQANIRLQGAITKDKTNAS